MAVDQELLEILACPICKEEVKLVPLHQFGPAEGEAEVITPELVEGQVALVEADAGVSSEADDGAVLHRAAEVAAEDAGVLQLDPGADVLGEVPFGRDADAVGPVVGLVVIRPEGWYGSGPRP